MKKVIKMFQELGEAVEAAIMFAALLLLVSAPYAILKLIEILYAD